MLGGVFITFVNSIIIGLALGSGIVFSGFYGVKDRDSLIKPIYEFFLIGLVSLTVSLGGFILTDEILRIMALPSGIFDDADLYTKPIFEAFAVAVKIDTIAYVPAQDFGNAFSTFIIQDYGAKKFARINGGIRKAFKYVTFICLPISLLVFAFAPSLMGLFVEANALDVINMGTSYLRIEGAFYVLIGFLFLFYGLYRGLGRPSISIVLTIISLGTRVLLSYGLAPRIGVLAIWTSIPIGWLLADIVGLFLMKKFSPR